MNGKKKYIVFSAALIVITALAVAGFQSGKIKKAGNAGETGNSENVAIAGKAETAGEIIYFYGQGCSHCRDVNKFLEENKIAEKVNFSKKEVWSNEENAAELQKKAEECGLPSDRIGVPFVYSSGECFIGGPKVVEFFKKAAGI